MSTIVDTHSIIEKERQETYNDKAFIEWCKELKIGSRVEKINDGKHRATELMNQYMDYYPKWVQRMYQ